jgi:hypothetical protein
MDDAPQPPPLPETRRANIAREIANLTRRPRLRDFETTIRQHSIDEGISYATARTGLETAWHNGHLLRRFILHNASWKWAFARPADIPPDQLAEYEKPPDPHTSPNT